jgi:hypothetical protein
MFLLILEPFMHRFFQWLVAILDAVSSVPLVLPYPLADLLGLNKCFSQCPLRALLVNTPLHPADSFHTFVNFSCQRSNINEEIAFRKLVTGKMITEMRKVFTLAVGPVAHSV